MGFDLRRDNQGVPVAAYNDGEDLLKFTSLQKKFRSDFIGTSLSPDKWELVQTGPGMTVTVTGSQLRIAAGTTNGSETIIRSKEIFQISLRALIQAYQSAKAANQEIYFEFISVDPTTGEPDGQHGAGWLIDGSSATTDYLKYSVQYGGEAPIVSANVDTNEAVTSVRLREIELFPDEAWFHSRQVDSVNARTSSFCKNAAIPDPNAYYKFQIRVKNNGVPAAAITHYISGITIVDFAELTTEITAGRGIAAPGQSIAVNVTGSITQPTQPLGRNLSYLDAPGIPVANAVLVGAARSLGGTSDGSTGNYQRFQVIVSSDQVGTLFLEQSRTTTDSDYKIIKQIDVPAGAGFTIPAVVGEMEINMRYARWRYVNGAAAATKFQVDTSAYGI
jgi:hypothetical protein